MKYQNLYKYSQQGWERVNGKAKRAYNHNTTKGGRRGGSSKLLPIMMTFLRELLWRFGVGDKLFNPNDNTEEGEEGLGIGNMTYGKVKKQKVASDEDLDLFVKTIMNIGSNEDIWGGKEDVMFGSVYFFH